MSRLTDTTTAFRITKDEAVLIRRSLVCLVAKHHHWEESGSPLYSPVTLFSHRSRIDEAEFSRECQANFLHVGVAPSNNFQAQSRRLHLNPIEIAACIVGVRVAEMLARHRHLKPSPPNYQVRGCRLLKKLERLRKRA